MEISGRDEIGLELFEIATGDDGVLKEVFSIKEEEHGGVEREGVTFAVDVGIFLFEAIYEALKNGIEVVGDLIERDEVVFAEFGEPSHIDTHKVYVRINLVSLNHVE